MIRFPVACLFGYILLLTIGSTQGDMMWSWARPHPFMFLVGALAVTYGWLPGLAAAGVGCALLGWKQAPVDSAMTLLLAAFWFGFFAQNLRERAGRSRVALLKQGADLLVMQERERILEKANDELRAELTRLNSQREPLQQAAVRLSSLSRTDEIQATLLELVIGMVGAQACTYYTRDSMSSGWRLSGARGHELISPELEVIPAGHGLVGAAGEQKALQSIRDFPLFHLDDTEVRVLAAPVVHPDTGQVLGVVGVEKLPFLRFNQDTARMLQGLAGLAGAALADPLTESRRDGQTSWSNLLGPAELRKRLRRLIAARRGGSSAPFSLLGMRVERREEVDPTVSLLWERALTLIARTHLRPSDPGGRTEAGELVFVLEDARLEDLGALRRIIANQILEFLPLWVGGEGLVYMGLTEGKDAAQPDDLLNDLAIISQPCHLLT